MRHIFTQAIKETLLAIVLIPQNRLLARYQGVNIDCWLPGLNFIKTSFWKIGNGLKTMNPLIKYHRYNK